MEQDANYLDLLDLLQEENALTANKPEAPKEFMEKWNVREFEAILENQILSESQLADILANKYKAKRISPAKKEASDELAKKFVFSMPGLTVCFLSLSLRIH